LACVQCRRRKVRCDHEEPCGQCSRLGGGSGVAACWYQADQHAGVSVSDHNGLSTTGVPIRPIAAVPGSDLSSVSLNWPAADGTVASAAVNTDLLEQPNNARNHHGLGTTLQPYAIALAHAQDHAPPSVSDLQDRVQRVEELAIQANASPFRSSKPAHASRVCKASG
jgi:hypothetical protein